MQQIRNFCIISHIDHGKSTLADRFLELTKTVETRKMQAQYLDSMDLERERGITIKLQPVRMQYGEYMLNLIDTPGHVDFSYEVSRSLAAVEGAVLLVDATKGIQAQTLANLNLAQQQKLTIIPVVNKIDLPNARTEEITQEVCDLLVCEPESVLHISAKTGQNVEQVLKAVIDRIPAPDTKEDVSLRALIFDSQFDTYKGVIAFSRVMSGSVSRGDRVELAATGAKVEVLEVGHFSPNLVVQDTLHQGEIGYIATGLKSVDQVRVGDTIRTPGASSLAGYKEPRPMVFASFYPENSDDYDDLREALGKLALTDAALIFEPESSPGLGRGFRLGFLGMLHIEIISERLRREFKLKLIISTPSVEYHVLTKQGETLDIRSAALLPDPTYIESIEEPIVKVELLSPASYLGALMKLMGETRAMYKDTRYVGKETVILEYDIPLSEIVTDFYDRLKSVSSGYASMSYEPAGYQEADLVRLDILVAGDIVEPFSKIVPQELAYREGRRIVEKLKNVIPKQLFAVTLQAAIGGKVIARETLSAMRKDVTGYLYGGDVTRKKKLLEKQKRGKARMKERGTVDIPQEVFLEMLKK